MKQNPRMSTADSLQGERSILFVDDDSTSRKWFALTFADEFRIVTADSVSQALALLAERANEFAVLVTDYRMPEADGMKLLQTVQRDHRHLIRLLATAYAEKDVAIAAVNLGKVLRILEKPLNESITREALREALALHRTQALERAMNEGRAAALRETLGFLAHELNTPLATIRGCVGTVIDRYHAPGAELPEGAGTLQLLENQPGELIGALERADRRALYCQSLVSTFVQSAREAYPGASPQSVKASSLVDSLLDEFPFEDNERTWVFGDVAQDFSLPGRRDLLYLVLCTLTKNTLIALRGGAEPKLRITVGIEDGPQSRNCIRFVDNGPGIPPSVLAKLTREPVTTRADSGGNGMGLMFCQRVMQSIGGAIGIESEPGLGASVTLFFRPPAE
jgi:two-component system response regulator PhcR